MNKLNCSIVQDLLPSYIENLTSEKTAREIKNHIDGCDECRKIYNDMSGGETASTESDKKEINYLKKINNKTVKIIVSIILIAIIAITIPFTKYCVIGINDTFYSADIAVDGDTIRGEGVLFSSAQCFSKVSFDYDNGTVTMNVYSVLPLLNRNATAAFDIYYVADGNIERVQASNGDILWEDGEISAAANSISNSKAKYVGDNTAVSHLVDSVIQADNLRLLSGYSLHLITDNKPYGLEIYDMKLDGELRDDEYRGKIRKAAHLILACVENLDYIDIQYRLPSGIDREYKLTLDDANKNRSESIKDKVQSVRGIQTFMDELENASVFIEELKYTPCIKDGLSAEDYNKLCNNPIDEKYIAMLEGGKAPDDEGSIYTLWAEDYEKQYKIIYSALEKYARSNDLYEYLKPLESNSSGNDIADLLYAAINSKDSTAGEKHYAYCEAYLIEARQSTLRLAECAYYLDVDFEWIT